MDARSVKIPPQAFEIFRPFARMIAEELAELQNPREEPEVIEGPVGSRVLKGIQGIMDIFQCSRSKASKIKDSGIIDGAITRISSRIFLVNEKKALEIMEKKMKGGRRY